MFKDIVTFINFLKYQNNVKRVFFFENNFVEPHLIPYVSKNNNLKETIIVSLYKIENNSLKNFKIFQFHKIFFFKFIFFTFENKILLFFNSRS